jgi:hypothetical protein
VRFVGQLIQLILGDVWRYHFVFDLTLQVFIRDLQLCHLINFVDLSIVQINQIFMSDSCGYSQLELVNL